jgi:hypothetical protein
MAERRETSDKLHDPTGTATRLIIITDGEQRAFASAAGAFDHDWKRPLHVLFRWPQGHEVQIFTPTEPRDWESSRSCV